MLDRSPSRSLTCARCGDAFACAPGDACWCAAEPYRLPMPSADMGDCLCPDCLRAAAAAQARAVA